LKKAGAMQMKIVVAVTYEIFWGKLAQEIVSFYPKIMTPALSVSLELHLCTMLESSFMIIICL
jgi:hypothetical protein